MNRQRLWLIFGGICWVAYFAIALKVEPSPEPALWPQITSMVFGLAILMAILLSGERPSWPAYLRWVMFIAGLVFVVIPYLMNENAPIVRSFVALGLMMVALPIGYWIGERMQKATNLVPLAVAMSLADVYSVFMGPSRRVAETIAEHQEEVAQVVQDVTAREGAAAAAQAAAQLRAPLGDFIVVHLPMAGTGGSMPVLGIGDFIIFAFLFRAAWVHGLSVRAIFIAGFVSTCVALAASNFARIALPALPFIAIGTVGYLFLTEPRMRKLDKQETMLTVVVGILFIGLIAFNYVKAWLGI